MKSEKEIREMIKEIKSEMDELKSNRESMSYEEHKVYMSKMSKWDDQIRLLKWVLGE